MRLELAGSLFLPKPLVIRFDSNQTFDTQYYIDLGYTHFDVICIGGGGGMGGGIDTANSGTFARSYGGAGGGGGFHRIRGLLSALPTTCPVVVGAGGALGTEHASNPASTTDGGDGGVSSFNDPTCRASGGKGGKRVQTNSLTASTAPERNGGDGGLGNRVAAGGGAAGGVAGVPSATGPGTPGTPGTDGNLIYDFLYQDIGQGGGGGAGGVGKYGSGGTTCNAATAGGRGSFNPGDVSVYGPADLPGNDPSSGSQSVIAGGASGAKASPLNGLPYVFGQSKGERLVGDPGAVILRLTAE
jgi:hypothetical protein